MNMLGVKLSKCFNDVKWAIQVITSVLIIYMMIIIKEIKECVRKEKTHIIRD
jgi:hypothetical protein